MTPRNLPESVLHFQSFCFAYFFVSIVVVSALSSLVALTLKTILDMRLYRRFDGKRAKKSTSAGTHTKLQIYWFKTKLVCFRVISYSLVRLKELIYPWRSTFIIVWTNEGVSSVWKAETAVLGLWNWNTIIRFYRMSFLNLLYQQMW